MYIANQRHHMLSSAILCSVYVRYIRNNAPWRMVVGLAKTESVISIQTSGPSSLQRYVCHRKRMLPSKDDWNIITKLSMVKKPLMCLSSWNMSFTGNRLVICLCSSLVFEGRESRGRDYLSQNLKQRNAFIFRIFKYENFDKFTKYQRVI